MKCRISTPRWEHQKRILSSWNIRPPPPDDWLGNVPLILITPRKVTARPPEKSKEIHQSRDFQVLTSGENGTHQPINQWSRMSQRLPTSSPDGGTSLLHIHANRHVRDHHYRSWTFLPSNHRAADPVWRQKVEWDEKSDRQGAKTPVELEKEREIAIMYGHCGSVSTITYILLLTLPSFHHHPFHHHHQPKSGRKNIL